MKKNIIIAIVGLGVLGGIGAGAYIYTKKGVAPEATAPAAEVANGTVNQVADNAVVVTLTKEGYVPDTISIKSGDTVTFKNTTGNLHWPASNLHPSHRIYSEFDPQEPISPTDTWSFTFTKVGEWKFHDHLSPYFTGVITVTE